jgi:hypothetical protein
MASRFFITLSCLVGLQTLAEGAPNPSKCRLSFDGRVPLDATAALFASNSSAFNPKYVLGQNVTWDKIIEFPQVPPGRVSIAVDRV